MVSKNPLIGSSSLSGLRELVQHSAGDLGKEASLTLQPSVNGATRYVSVAQASHHNWAEPSDKVALQGRRLRKVRISCDCVAWGWSGDCANGNVCLGDTFVHMVLKVGCGVTWEFI